MEEQKQIKVTLFGGLTMEGMGGCLTVETLRSPMLTKLLAYMLCHHKDKCLLQDMVEALWPDENSENPAGALKNLMYRLRTVLKKVWPGEELITTGKGFYRWNDDLMLQIDMVQFEDLSRNVSAKADNDDKIDLYLQMVDLYKGQLLAGFNDTYWLASMATYYASLYQTAVKKLSELLEQQERYAEMERVCKTALSEDTLDEDLHYWFIKSLCGQQKYQLASEQYHKAEEILYDNLGVRMSEKTQQLYRSTMAQMHEQEASLDVILADLGNDTQKGAFVCEYGVFRQIFQLQQRRSERLGVSVYLALITIVPEFDLARNSPRYRELIKTAAHSLQDALTNSLRSGDVITRYSGNQYLVLLPTCQYESAKMVMGRIQKLYFAQVGRLRVKLEYSLDEIV